MEGFHHILFLRTGLLRDLHTNRRSSTDRAKLLRSREPLLQVSDNSSWSMVPPRLPKSPEDRASVSTYRSTDPLLKRVSSEKGSFITSPRSITDENLDEKTALYDGAATPRRSISALPQRGQADTWHLDLAVQQGRIDIIQNVLRLWVPELDDWKHQQLPKACRDGNEPLVKCLLKNGADARARETPESYLTTGRTALHLAAIQGNLEIAKALIEYGASVNEIYTGYRTPLHEAASRGYAAMTELLLQQGAPVDACDESRYRPIHSACMAGSYDVVKSLLKYGANLNSFGNDKYRPIHHAAQDGGNPELIALLSASGADIEAETPFQYRPLQLACKAEKDLVVSALLKAGADPNGGEDLKPLQLAARSGNTTVVQVLIDAGAEIDFGAGEGSGIELNTPLGIALYSRNLPVIAKLLEAGASVDAANAVGFAPIHMVAMGHSISPTLASVQERRDEALRILLQHNPDCKAADYRGYQVFHYLADSANFVSFDALHVRKLTAQFLNSGADINAIDGNGDSPLDIAAINMKSWLIHIFVESGARALKPSTLRNLAAATHSPKREVSFDATKTLQHLRNFKITQHPRSVTV
jgi:ankyrin repeat protein